MSQEFRSKLTKAADQREDEARGLAVEEKRSSQSQSCFKGIGLGDAPPPSSSYQQDSYIFSRGSIQTFISTCYWEVGAFQGMVFNSCQHARSIDL